MTKSQCFGFCNCVGKFKEPPMAGLLVGNFEKGDGVNGSLPFFVEGNSHKNYSKKMKEPRMISERVLL
jgi:hypothetical protein